MNTEDRRSYKDPLPSQGSPVPGPLGPEDYAEPRCVLCDEPYGAQPEVRSVPQQRIIEKMDDYMSRRDYAGAERHLLYWLEEARLGHDLRGQLMLRGELVGHYRKTGQRAQAFENIDAALDLLQALDYEGTISAGTTWVNCATACQAFGEPERALMLFEKARAAYEASAYTRPELLGGLYNNMALTCASLKRYEEALELYGLAMERMGQVRNGELEQAITQLNMANIYEEMLGAEEAEPQISACLDRAADLLDTPSVPRDGYYAFVCEKCAPTFSYYGWFLAARDFSQRAERIYRENREQ